jgi:hypothetical protein
MTERTFSRRHFLAGVVAAVATAAVGGIAGAVRALGGGGEPQPAEAMGTTSTTAPSATTTSTTSTTTSTTTTTTTAPGPEETTTTSTTEPARLIETICASAWGALPAAGEFREHVIERLTVHHTAVVLESNTDAPSHLRGHQKYHIERGWPDLAYHLMIDADGNVYEGRPMSAVGDTGTNYDPTGHLLVCLEGHFDEQPLPEPQLLALIDVLAWATQEFAVGADTIRGHRDLASTTCPGDAVYTHIADGSLVAEVNARSLDTRFERASICGPEGEARVAAIEHLGA